MVHQLSKSSARSQRVVPSDALKAIVSPEKAALAVNFLSVNVDFFAGHLKKAYEDSLSYGFQLNASLDDDEVEPLWRAAFVELDRKSDSGEGFVDFYEAMLGDPDNNKKGLVDRDTSAMLALISKSRCLLRAVCSCATSYNRWAIESWRHSKVHIEELVLQAEQDLKILREYGAEKAGASLEGLVKKANSYKDRLEGVASAENTGCSRVVRELSAFFPHYKSMLIGRSQREREEINKKIAKIRLKASALKCRVFDKDSCGEAVKALNALADNLEAESKRHYNEPLVNQLKGHGNFFEACIGLIEAASKTQLSNPRFGLKKLFYQAKTLFVSLMNGILKSSHKAVAPKTASLKLVDSAKGLFANSNALFAGSPFAHAARTRYVQPRTARRQI